MQASAGPGDALWRRSRSDRRPRAETLAAVERSTGPAAAFASRGLLTARGCRKEGILPPPLGRRGRGGDHERRRFFRELAQLRALLLDEGLTPSDRAEAP